jgi:hypothetical protein
MNVVTGAPGKDAIVTLRRCDNMLIRSRDVTMEVLATSLFPLELGRPPIDNSGLKESFDFTLAWTAEPHGSAASDSPAPPAPVVGPTPIDLGCGTRVRDGSDEFNSEAYQQAQRSFSDEAAYEAARASGGRAPYRANREWNQEHTEFGPRQAAQYVRTVGRGALGGTTIELCGGGKWLSTGAAS